MASKPKPAVQPDRPRGVPRDIPIAEIFVTKNNLRTEFDTPKDAELVESIRANGIIERLIVRDNSKWRSKGDKRADYDLIAGERRLRAAIKAGLTIVPCEVFDVDDEKAYEMMTIENLQRDDLHELDYAKGLKVMMKRFGYTVEQCAQRIQKGETFVREMLSFDNLPANAEHAFRNGAITKSHAVLIGTIPDEKKREEFAKRVLTGKFDHHASGEPLSVRRTKELKEKEYMKDLSKAPFPLDQQLDPSWPHSCLTCPHYNGNTPEARQGKRPNICLNPTHYAVMERLFAESEAKRFEESGATVLSKTETAQVFEKGYGNNGYYLRHQDKFVKLTDEFTDYAKNYARVPWKQVAEKAEIETIVAVTPDGKLHKLLDKKKASEAAKTFGHKLEYPSARSSGSKRKPSASEKNRAAAAKARVIAATELMKKLRDFSWARAGKHHWQAFGALVVREVLEMGEAGEFLLPILGMPKPERGKAFQAERAFAVKYLNGLKSISQIQAYIATILAAQKIYEHVDSISPQLGSAFDKDDYAFAKQFGVDLKAIEKKAMAELVPTKKKKPAKAKRAGKMKLTAKPKAKVRTATA